MVLDGSFGARREAPTRRHEAEAQVSVAARADLVFEAANLPERFAADRTVSRLRIGVARLERIRLVDEPPQAGIPGRGGLDAGRCAILDRTDKDSSGCIRFDGEVLIDKVGSGLNVGIDEEEPRIRPRHRSAIPRVVRRLMIRSVHDLCPRAGGRGN
jgi:hypothetical protein